MRARSEDGCSLASLAVLVDLVCAALGLSPVGGLGVVVEVTGPLPSPERFSIAPGPEGGLGLPGAPGTGNSV